jgi:hypothetical protein
MKLDIDFFLGNFGALTITQYATARDAGFSPQELINRRQEWYDINKNEFSFTNKGKGPITVRQLGFLRLNVPEFNEEQAKILTFSQARKVIHELAKYINEETAYIEYILKLETHNKNWKARQLTSKTKKSIVQQPEPLAITENKPSEPVLENKPLELNVSRQFPGESIPVEPIINEDDYDDEPDDDFFAILNQYKGK